MLVSMLIANAARPPMRIQLINSYRNWLKSSVWSTEGFDDESVICSAKAIIDWFRRQHIQHTIPNNTIGKTIRNRRCRLQDFDDLSSCPAQSRAP